MTNKEAIKKLQSIRLHSLHFSNEEAEEIHKALILAMRSLDRFDGAVEVDENENCLIYAIPKEQDDEL